MYLRDSKFLISCAARTGSTFLLHLLRSNPDVLAHGEVLNIDEVGAMLGTYATKRRQVEGYELALHDQMMRYPDRFIQACIFDAQGYHVVGFKYKTDEAFQPQYRPFTKALLTDTDIKVIHLRRRDLLAQYVSHQVVLNQTSTTLVHRRSKLPRIEPFACDPRHAVDYFHDVTDREKRAVTAYQNHRSIQVDYEDMVDDRKDHARIQRFLDVPVRRLSSPTKKIIKDSRALVTNLEEAVSVLEEAGFADRLVPTIT